MILYGIFDFIFLLPGISPDPDLEKDALFLDKFIELLDSSEETSTHFGPHKLALRALYRRAKRDVSTIKDMEWNLWNTGKELMEISRILGL